MNLLITLLIIFTFLLLCDYFGFIVNKKLNVDTKLNYVSGFLFILALVEISGCVFMINHLSLTNYTYLFLAIILILLICSYKYVKEYINNIKTYKNKFSLITITISIIFFIILFIQGQGLVDSWLYSPMVLSSINNDAIFTNDGYNNLVSSPLVHILDGFYLLQAILVKIIPSSDKFIILISSMKFIDAFILIGCLALAINLIINKFKIPTLIIVSISYLIGCSIFSAYNYTDELFAHTFLSMPIGINFIVHGTLLVFIINYIKNKEINYIYFLIILIANFALSSSALYINAFILLIMWVYEIFINKDKSKLKYLVYGFFIIGLYISVLLKQYMIYILVIDIICLLIGLLLVKKLNYKQIKNITIGLLITYILINILGIIIFTNTSEIINNLFNLDRSKIYYISEFQYPYLFANIIVLITTLFGLYTIYKNDKRYLYWLIITVIICANPIMYKTIGSFINQVVYHRVYILLLTQVIAIIGLNTILILITNKYQNINIKQLTITGSLLILLVSFPKQYLNYQGYNSFNEFKYQQADIYQLINYNYDKTKNVSLGIIPSIEPNRNLDLTLLFRARGDLNYVSCSNEGYYLIVNNKDVNTLDLTKYNKELETPNYTLFYQQGDVCPLNE